MALYAGLAVDAGARIVGGCCGNEARAIVAAMRRALDAPSAGGPRPDRRARSSPRSARSRRRPRPNRRAALAAARAARAREPIARGLASFEVGAEHAGERLDRFLGPRGGGARLALSRTRLKALIEAGEVEVDGVAARDPAREGRGRRAHRGRRSAARGFAARGRGHRRSRVVFEDEHLIVIDKPAGLVVHPGARPCRGHAGQRADPPLRREPFRHRRGAAAGHRASARQGHLGAASSSPRPTPRTRGSPTLFADHGRTGSLAREYLALVWGALRRARGQRRRAARPPSAHQREKMAVVAEERGRARGDALARVEEALGPATLVACRLETGRTHQIRVHIAHIGHPLARRSRSMAAGSRPRRRGWIRGARRRWTRSDGRPARRRSGVRAPDHRANRCGSRARRPTDFQAFSRLCADRARARGVRRRLNLSMNKISPCARRISSRRPLSAKVRTTIWSPRRPCAAAGARP